MDKTILQALRDELGMPDGTIIDLFAELRKRLDVAYNNAHALDEARSKLSVVEAAADEMAFNIDRIMKTYAPPLQDAAEKYRGVCRKHLDPK